MQVDEPAQALRADEPAQARIVRARLDFWVSYDGKLTGSQEIRGANKALYEYLRASGRLTFVGQYAVDYDKPLDQGGANKIGEPHYDAFLVMIASLTDAEFDRFFHYLETQFSDELLPRDRDYPHPSMLKTDVVPESMMTRADLRYGDAIHIFLLGPATVSCYEKIRDICSKKGDRHVIIHVQGEANARDAANKTTNFSAPMMTPKPGMFDVAFNHWSGERQMYGIRQLCDRTVTVVLRDTEAARAEHAQQMAAQAAPPPQGLAAPYIPDILQNMTLFLRDSILTTTVPTPNQHEFFGMFGSFNYALCCEDLFDKDNCSAVKVLGHLSRTPVNVEVIGRRIYNFPNDATPHFGFPAADMAILQKVVELKGWPLKQMQTTTGEWQSPVFLSDRKDLTADNLTEADFRVNGPLDKSLTMYMLEAGAAEFQKLLTGTPNLQFSIPTEKSVTDGVADLSASNRAPFFQKMFAFPNFWSQIYEKYIEQEPEAAAAAAIQSQSQEQNTQKRLKAGGKRSRRRKSRRGGKRSNANRRQKRRTRR